MHLFDRCCDHDYQFELLIRGAGRPLNSSVFYCTPWRFPGCPACEPNSILLIIPPLAQHPVQRNCQSPRHGDLGDLSSPPHHQVKVSAAPFGKTAHCDLRRFYQQEAQDRTALFGDVSQPSPIAAGVLQWNQTEIAGHLLATLKAFGFPMISTNANAVSGPTPG